MEIKPQPKISFHGIDIIHINFDSKQVFSATPNQKIDFKIVPKVFYPSYSSTIFNILMNVSLAADDYFHLELEAVGNFEFESELDETSKRSLVNANAPAIMFPYIRAFVSTLTANIGNPTGTLTIPVHFFNGEMEEIRSAE